MLSRKQARVLPNFIYLLLEMARQKEPLEFSRDPSLQEDGGQC